MSSEVISLGTRQKKSQLERLLSDRSVFIKVFLGAPGLQVPPTASAEPFLVLQVSNHFRTSLFMGDDYLEQELLFGDRYVSCRIPFSAIVIASNESGDYVDWSAEHDLASVGSATTSHADKGKSVKQSEEKGDNAAGETGITTEPDDPRRPTKPGRPALRRVK
jgi:stringent starvation protein B